MQHSAASTRARDWIPTVQMSPGTSDFHCTKFLLARTMIVHVVSSILWFISGLNLTCIVEEVSSDSTSMHDDPISTIRDAPSPQDLKYIVIGGLVFSLIKSRVLKYLSRLGWGVIAHCFPSL